MTDQHTLGFPVTVDCTIRGGWDGDAWDEDADDGEGDWVRVPAGIQSFRLYHWAPTARRRQITRYGLRPRQRPSISTEWRAPYVCFADSPSWAWALSGGMPWAPPGEWDLWETDLWSIAQHGVPDIIPAEDRVTGVHEVRVEARVFKRSLWLVGSRMKP